MEGIDKKPGVKTSEFWVGILTGPVVAIIAAFMSYIDAPLPEHVLVTFVAPSVAYIIGRVWQKSARIKAAAQDVF